jgi:putative sigma-54 modulation protein
MNLRLRVTHAEAQELLRRYIERKLRFAFGRLNDRVEAIAVSLSGVADRSGDSRCRITTELRPTGSLSVEEHGPDVFGTIDRAASRVGRQLARRVDRLRTTRMGRESIRLVA